MNVLYRVSFININKIIFMDDMIIMCVIYIFKGLVIIDVYYMYYIKVYQILNSICMYL